MPLARSHTSATAQRKGRYLPSGLSRKPETGPGRRRKGRITGRRGTGSGSNRTIGPRNPCAIVPVPSRPPSPPPPRPRARAHARRYLAERDKSLVPHVIKSFSRTRGSKGKERRTLERGQGGEGGAGGRHTTDHDAAALCASWTTKDSRADGREEGGRQGEKERERRRRLNGVKRRRTGGGEGEGRGGGGEGKCLRRGGTRTDIHH